MEGKLIQEFEGLDVGDRVRVQLIGTDAERGFIDFAQVDEDREIEIPLFQSNEILLPHDSTFLKIYGEKADLMKGDFD